MAMKLTARAAGLNRTGVRVPANRSFERELAQLESMSSRELDAEAQDRVRKSLGNANNYLVAKAASIVTDRSLVAALPDVLAAYGRFFEDAVKSDPQCGAKTALAKALVKLEYRASDVYLRGLHHTQEEPVWGGQSDTAGALRGICTHALVACDDLTTDRLLEHLLVPLVDPDKTVRVEAVRAIGHVGGVTAGLLLKLRILLRKEEPEVLGAAFSALLGLENGDRPSAIALVAGFLNEGEECAAEAAFALAETHEAQALSALLERRAKGAESWFGSVLDHAIVLTRLPQGLEFLLRVIESEPRKAGSALEAISRVHNSAEIRARVAASVKLSQSERVLLAFHQYFPEPPTES